MQSSATSVEAYLRSLPPERRQLVQAVREVILKNLPKGYKEIMQYGMIGYVVPLSRYPAGYLGQKDVPLPYVGLAAQKNYYSIYLLNIYGDKKAETWFKKEYERAGFKLDMGKSCVRFKTLDKIPLEVIGKAVALTPVDEFITMYEKARNS